MENFGCASVLRRSITKAHQLGLDLPVRKGIINMWDCSPNLSDGLLWSCSDHGAVAMVFVQDFSLLVLSPLHMGVHTQILHTLNTRRPLKPKLLLLIFFK